MALNAAALALLAERGAVVSRWLLWVEARNRVTGLTETMGLWTGEDEQTFSIGGDDRLYHGAGGLISISDLVYEAGTNVRMQSLSLGPLTQEVELLIRGYDTRLAPAEIHVAVFDPDTMALVDTDRRFKGWIDKAQINTPKLGGPAVCEVTCASNARAGTQTLALKKSDQSQQRRGGDRFRRYADISGSVPVYWGEERADRT